MGAVYSFRVSIITGYGMNMHARGNGVCSVVLCSNEHGWYRVMLTNCGGQVVMPWAGCRCGDAHP